ITSTSDPSQSPPKRGNITQQNATTTTTKQNTRSENTCSVPTKTERDHHHQEFARPAAPPSSVATS
ncbi:hypothetical protein A2U01_0098243, partial [Trifolium medium]|nr:hypothetical protein [Trifolium medium]